MTAALKNFRTIQTSRIYDPAESVRQLVIAQFGGRVLWDPVYRTPYCMACLNDVPAALVHAGISPCCLV
jgi:hypothetical protein